MKPIRRGELEENIASAVVTFSDTGETCVLKTHTDSVCHFFDQFTVGNYNIQLRLHWSDMDCNGQPTLDADFIDHKTGKHLSLKGKRFDAHHTTSSPGERRCYEWKFDGFSRHFSVAVTWCASVMETLSAADFCSAEVIPAVNCTVKNDKKI